MNTRGIARLPVTVTNHSRTASLSGWSLSRMVSYFAPTLSRAFIALVQNLQLRSVKTTTGFFATAAAANSAPLGLRAPACSTRVRRVPLEAASSVSLPPPMQVPLMNTRGTLFFPAVASNHCLITSLSGRLLISSTEYLAPTPSRALHARSQNGQFASVNTATGFCTMYRAMSSAVVDTGAVAGRGPLQTICGSAGGVSSAKGTTAMRAASPPRTRSTCVSSSLTRCCSSGSRVPVAHNALLTTQP
mmetsp:Transcript_92311/g.154885  ORF Transcript_92311/g.154885 Transcript_92311/m.154885 type:complete len:246 (+) Transcript_92311:918-1655(+)